MAEPIRPMVPWLKFGVLYTNAYAMCQEILPPSFGAIFTGKEYFSQSHRSILSLQIALILISTTTMGFILRPLRLPFIAHITAGIILGAMLSGTNFDMGPMAPGKYIVRTIAYMGFQLHAFMLGVETSKNVIKYTNKKSIFIGFFGVLSATGFAYAGQLVFSKYFRKGPPRPGDAIMHMSFNIPTFFMVVCTHLNDLGISNSELGQLAAASAFVLDIIGVVVSFVFTNVIIPLQARGNFDQRPVMILSYYFVIYCLFRPLIKYIISLTPEGRPMKQSHFLFVILCVLMIAFLGELIDERYAMFIFAFSLPEEPLGSILNERLDPINSTILVPIFCALHGMGASVHRLLPASLRVELVFFAGYLGKFVGTVIASIICGVKFSHSVALGLVMSSKGLMDVALIGVWRERMFMLGEQDYTVAILHVVILTGLFLPLVKFLYVPSRQYSTILRRSVIEIVESGSFHTLACIFKEENVPGVMHLLEMSHPTRSNPLSIIALQLLQLTGRAALPFVGPLDQVTSSSAFRSNLARCNRIVNAFLHFERENKGNTFVQHYVAVSPYATMHNDICKLAYDKGVNMVIVPFHARWSSDAKIEDASLPIREVNTRVLEKAPCSVGLFIDRGLVSGGSKLRSLSSMNNSTQRSLNDPTQNLYRIAVLFAGGGDDQEALALSRLFVRHPSVRVVVVWLKGPKEEDVNSFDYDVMMQFRQKCGGNDRVSFREAVVNDGAETTQVMVSMKDALDLVMVGKHHDSNCAAVFGLSDGWTEYPELGIIGDMLASSDFKFSILVVQHEQKSNSSDVDVFDDM